MRPANEAAEQDFGPRYEAGYDVGPDLRRWACAAEAGRRRYARLSFQNTFMFRCVLVDEPKLPDGTRAELEMCATTMVQAIRAAVDRWDSETAP